MKKIMLIVLSLVLSISLLIGCAPKSNDAGSNNSSNMSAVMVTAQRLGDKGVTDLCNEGFEKAGEDFGFDTKVVEVQKGEYEETLRALSEDGYDAIVVLWSELVDATQTVAAEYPDQKFVSIFSELEVENVKSITTLHEEGSYLAGILAAMTSQTDKIGFVGGSDNPSINRFFSGYQQGALSVKPNIEIIPTFVGSFEDPARAKDLSLMLYSEGADVIYHAAAKSGLGLFEAASEAGKYAIGVDVNQNDLAPGLVLGSMQISYDKWVYDSLKEISEDNFESGLYGYGLTDDNLFLSIADENLRETPQEIIDEINEAKEKIVSGEIEVWREPQK